MKLYAYTYCIYDADVIVVATNVVEADELLRLHLEDRGWTVAVVQPTGISELAPGILFSNLLVPVQRTEALPLAPLREISVQTTSLEDGKLSSDVLTNIRTNLGVLQSKYDRRKENSNAEVPIERRTSGNQGTDSTRT